jgi:serine O-acetyltransferase
VTVCSNAFVCGNITIGDDVLIAANAFVNFDVPDHSIVIGNPAKIIHKDNATESYIDNRV